MPIVEVKNLKNEVVGTLPLADSVFNVDVNEHLVWEAVKHYLSSKRAGTHKAKTRGEVSGGGKKPWRQKGTGRARVGSSRNPLWRHGGVTHAKQPRDYGDALPKRMIRGALKSALSAKLNEHKLTVVEAFDLPDHQTKNFRVALDRFHVDKSALVIDSPENTNLVRASRNLPRVKFAAKGQVTVYDVVKYDQVLFSKAAITELQEVLSR